MRGSEGFELINDLGRKGTPFICLIDFEAKNIRVEPIETVDPSGFLFDINGTTNATGKDTAPLQVWEKSPVSRDHYFQAFQRVQAHIHGGNTFLLNLTFPTRLVTNLSLENIFHRSKAKYKLWIRDQFVTFSPEPFIKIRNGTISSFPMKGTIQAAIPNARELLLEDPKELAEHMTIVDLIRNDLSMVATKIKVEKFRYIDRVKTAQQDLLQVSSKITGRLTRHSWDRLGDLLKTILPAGSISGAPKRKTLEIIREVEDYDRGYFSGIVGLFDGYSFDSGVMIRFVQQTEEGLMFKSGGGLTVNSEWEKEYQEMIDKVYVPII